MLLMAFVYRASRFYELSWYTASKTRWSRLLLEAASTPWLPADEDPGRMFIKA